MRCGCGAPGAHGEIEDGTWTNAGMPAADHLASWQALADERFCPVTISHDGEGPFTSRVTGRSVGPIDVSLIASCTQVVRHSADQARSGTGRFFLNLPLDAGSRMTQDGRTADLAPGDFAIVDSTRPFELAFDHHFEQLSVTLPSELFAPRLADPRCATATRIAGDHGVGAVAGGALRALAAGGLSRAAAPAVADQVIGLIALAVGGVTAVAPPPRELLAQAAFDEVERGLNDPALSPAFLAERLSVSPRYLSALFAQRGTTFGRWVLARRLHLCQVALADPAQAERSIADVAHAHGFADPSYFARAFRARYGVSPRDGRARDARSR